MAKTHFTATELTEDATVSDIMRRKAACGSKATSRAALYMSTDWDEVDCIKCHNSRQEVEQAAGHKAEIARIKARG